MMKSVSVVVDPYDEYRRPEHPEIPFQQSLSSLLNQTYPKECVEILIISSGRHAGTLPQDDPHVRWITAPDTLGYYQKKDFGAELASSDIVLFTDGDCLYPMDWIEKMVLAFERGGERVAAVQGLSRFRKGPFSFALDAIYWTCGFELEGSIRQIYSVHNLGIRKALHSQFHFEDSPIRAGLERIISPKIRNANYMIWHNRQVQV